MRKNSYYNCFFARLYHKVILINKKTRWINEDSTKMYSQEIQQCIFIEKNGYSKSKIIRKYEHDGYQSRINRTSKPC